MSAYDQVTPKQKSFIVRLMYAVSPRVTTHTKDDEAIAELNSLCNLNISSLDELSRKEASQVIDQLQALQ